MSTPSVSRSVARGLAVLELLATRRERLTAAAIGRALRLPQPSARALLKNLEILGYLQCDPATRGYAPTARVAALGAWQPGAEPVAAPLRLAIDRIAAAAGETASVSTLRDLDVDVLYVCKARHPVALQLEPGTGARLWRTVVGRTLLATLDDTTLHARLAGLARAERSPADRRAVLALPRELRRIRAAGYGAGYDLFLTGVGAVCVALKPAPGAAPRVAAVAGLRERIRPREAALVRLLRRELRAAGS